MSRKKRYVIVGNSTAAVAAVEAIRMVDQEGSITLLASEPYHTYSRPLISYYLASQVEEAQLAYRPRDFYERNQVTPLLGVQAVKLEPEKQRVFLALRESAAPEKDRLSRGLLDRQACLAQEIIAYDRLLLATGSQPAVPPIKGINLSGIHYFYTLEDVKRLKINLPAKATVVVLGSGLIGLKAAEALSKLGCRVIVVELAEQILNTILDRQAADLIQSWFEEHGVSFMLGSRAEACVGEEQVAGVKLADGSVIKCDKVVVAAGVRPVLDLVKDTAIEFRQGILVNAFLETSLAGIYCAGDVCEGFDRLQGENKLAPILPNASRQGRVAGLNMAGMTTAWPGTIVFNATTFFGLPVATMGLTRITGEGIVHFDQVKETNGYRDYCRLIFKDERLVGAILINRTQRCGILQRLIQEQLPARHRKDSLLKEAPRLIDFPAIIR